MSMPFFLRGHPDARMPHQPFLDTSASPSPASSSSASPSSIPAPSALSSVRTSPRCPLSASPFPPQPNPASPMPASLDEEGGVGHERKGRGAVGGGYERLLQVAPGADCPPSS